MAIAGYQIPDTLNSEIDELDSLITLYRSGSVSDTQLKAHRVPFGIYEQRTRGTYMVRIRCTAGIITPSQLHKVAELASSCASGLLHVTTRQEIQIHDVNLEDLIPILRALASVGLSTRGGGGNTVRNITAPWDAGISTAEPFDVTPYAVALTSFLIARPDSWLLPRKYKIAFSHSEKNSEYAAIADLGLVARVVDGTPGFRVYVAGGLGRNSQIGKVLHDFIPASEIFITVEAIKQLFSQHGNRKNKHAARLRYLWQTLGEDKFLSLYRELRRSLAGVDFGIHSIENSAAIPSPILPVSDGSNGFLQWKRRYVLSQVQPGLYSIRLPLALGMISAQQAMHIAEILSHFGDNTIRFTHDQNISIRNIPEDYLGSLYQELTGISPLVSAPGLLGNAIACAGASTCQLGIARARGALEAIIERLVHSPANLDGLGDLRLHISGCSNTCGQHMIADLGFFGKVGRKDQRIYPAYVVVSGASLNEEGGYRLSEKIGEISARDLPVLVEDFLTVAASHRLNHPSWAAYFEAEGNVLLRKLCDRYKEVPLYEENREYYRDWGDSEDFSLAGKGTGECSAGLFDLIEVDLNRLRQLREGLQDGKSSDQSELRELALVSARMLLITRGVEAASEREIFQKFDDLFIKQRLVGGRFGRTIEKLLDATGSSSLYEEVIDLSRAVEELYASMDNSLQFKSEGVGLTLSFSEQKSEAAVSKDLRGIACPMNFVKTKMFLAGMKSGQILEILLDDGAPIENVPKSVAEEGHAILSSERENGYWRVRIAKR